MMTMMATTTKTTTTTTTITDFTADEKSSTFVSLISVGGCTLNRIRAGSRSEE